MSIDKAKAVFTESLELQNQALVLNIEGRKGLEAAHAALGGLFTMGRNDFYAISGDSLALMSNASRALGDGYWRINKAHTLIYEIGCTDETLLELGLATSGTYSLLSQRTSDTDHKIFRLNEVAAPDVHTLIKEILEEDLPALIDWSQELDVIDRYIALTQEFNDSL